MSGPSPGGAGAVTPSAAVDASHLQLALDRLGVLGSVLYVAAHPDDENTALLAYLARGRLVRTAYLSLTRGDGGQNLIGDEQGELLGVIRTQELLQARQQDGAEQFFTRAIDFGYTKSLDETLAVWGKHEVLGDVVAAIRRLRPDVIITRFNTGPGGHGQHTASAVLALEAFTAAADPARYPEQLEPPESLEAWQAKRLFWDSTSPFGDDRERQDDELEVDLGTYNPLLGESYTEIAAASRSMHKSQGFGSTARRGSTLNHLQHRLGAPATSDLFDGIDVGWSRIEGGEAVGALIRQATASFDPRRPWLTVPLLAQARDQLQGLRERHWTRFKDQELLDAIRAASGLWLEAISPRASASPGDQVTIAIKALHRSPLPLRLERVELSPGLSASPVARATTADLSPNRALETELTWSLPPELPPTGPYWLAQPPTQGLFAVENRGWIGRPEASPLAARFTLSFEGHELPYEVPLLYRFTDRVDGELYRAFEIVPPVVVDLLEHVVLFSDPNPKTVSVVVQSTGPPVTGSLRLRLPESWGVEPERLDFTLGAGELRRLELSVRPPAAPGTGEVFAEAVAELAVGTQQYDRALSTLDYPHIPMQTVLPRAEARLVRLELSRSGERIGYVMGAGDAVPEALRQVGYEVSLLSDAELAGGDLQSYDAIVVGVRAFNARPAVEQYKQRLLDYVHRGGTLVAQYNTASRFGPGLEDIGPYPFRISNERVAEEDAAVRLLQPDHPIFQQPNRIMPQDFEGWVQERGLYFAQDWDERFVPLLSCHDSGEPERTGGLLYARYGDGVYIYTGYSFFRQLPAGVPGAYRLFVNLLSASSANGEYHSLR